MRATSVDPETVLGSASTVTLPDRSENVLEGVALTWDSRLNSHNHVLIAPEYGESTHGSTKVGLKP